jgi:hypothetical protein
MTYTSYDIRFSPKDFTMTESETYPVQLTEWEITRLMKALERNGDDMLEVYRKLARATRLTW